MSRFRTLQKTVSKNKHYLIDLQYIRCIFAQYLSEFFETYFEHPTLQGATAPTRDTQGVASLALGYVLHWAFSPPLLNPKLQKSRVLDANHLQA